MTKQDFKQNLKKSKSEEQISLVPPTPLERSKSDRPFTDSRYPYTTLISQTQEIEALRKESETKSTTISLLRKKIGELESKNFPVSELDQALFARHKNLKDWFTQYQKSQHLDKELVQSVNEASQELIEQDKVINSLRGANRQLKTKNESLSRDLELAQRAVAWRKRGNSLSEAKKPYLPVNPPGPFLENSVSAKQIIFYTLISVGFLCWLFKPQ